VVRTGKALSSEATEARLSTGALVEELSLQGERLNYRLISGTGPPEGWVSLKVSGKELVVRKEEPSADSAGVQAPDAQDRPVVGPGAGYRLRLAVNIHEWSPEGEENGPEFQFLLNLIVEEDERKAVMRYKFYDDKKRALLSRLLMRAASASALGMPTWTGISVKRTKGRKPFLASPLPPEKEAPNFNLNVSHEGAWVVCASEPTCVAGIDVAELRRLKANGEPVDFKKSFKDNLTANEWAVVEQAGSDPDAQYEVFSRFWSAKESFVKARGDGLAFELGKAEFHWTPLAGFPDGSAFEGKVLVEGKAAPLWRFVQHRMPGEVPHWTTVARGPVSSVIDAKQEFLATLRKPAAEKSAKEWEDALSVESPPCNVVPIAALVPQDQVDAYVSAGGQRWE